MIQYINEIITPYVKSQRVALHDPTLSALVIVDNFRGQVTAPVIRLLEEHNIHVCLLPPNTTDLLQPLDIAINKPAKDYLKRRFEEWYGSEVTKQLHGISDIESAVIQPVDQSTGAIKEQSAKWLVDMAEHIADNPQFIVHGFLCGGITYALLVRKQQRVKGIVEMNQQMLLQMMKTMTEDWRLKEITEMNQQRWFQMTRILMTPMTWKK